MLIRDGSLLDEDGLRMVAEMADARGAQVWIERVSSTGNVGVVMEDGQVAKEWNGITDETAAALEEIHDANMGTPRAGTLQLSDDETTI